MANLLWWLLGALVFPAWLLSGSADYLCHARTDIAHTSGRHESALHLLQTVEIGLTLLVFLFFEVDALVLAILLAGVVAHTATSWADLRWATPRREITPGEQYVHSFLNVLPWIALALVAVLHWPVVAALADPATPSHWSLRLRAPTFPLPLLATVLVSSLLFGVLPGIWEYARTVAAARQASSSSARSPTKPR